MNNKRPNQMLFLAIFSLAILFNTNISIAQHHEESGKKVSSSEVFESLQSGNEHFKSNEMTKHDLEKQREEGSKGQAPKVIVVTCSDSRVPPELIFDKGLGEIFVVRTAGNVVDSVAIGSIEYAAEHLGSQMILVLGHKSCGAVKATLGGETPSPYINSIIHLIQPALATVKSNHVAEDKVLDATIEQNVKNQIETCVTKSKIIHELNAEGKLVIIGAVYDLKSGNVDYITNHNFKPEGEKHEKHEE
jgi:carbonic anhydrase